MTTGVKASVDAAGGRDAVREADDERRAAEGEQLALLAEEERARDAALPLPPPPRRGPGRPVGARNRKTQELAAYYLGRYTDPLEALLALGSGAPAHTLAQLRAIAAETGLELGVGSVMGLLQFKRSCLEAALPYLHAKRAPENEKGDVVVPILAIGTVAPGAEEAAARAAAGGAVSIMDLVRTSSGVFAEMQSDQGLSEGEAEGSHGEGSHDEG